MQRIIRHCLTATVVTGLILLMGCAAVPPSKEPDQLRLLSRSFADLPGWSEDSIEDILPALAASCKQILAKRDSDPMPVPTLGTYNLGQVRDWRPICVSADTLEASDRRRIFQFFNYWFRPYQVRGENGEVGLFTGYYEPELRGSRTRNKQYQYPIYGLPSDLITVNLGDFSSEMTGKKSAGRLSKGRFVPYYSRNEIERGALKDQKLELVFVDDPVDAYFLAIQGSGRVVLDDGTILRLGYAGSNGQDYVSIGAILVKSGEIPLEKVSMQSIRAWLKANPQSQESLLNSNPSYIFFRPVVGKSLSPDDGPVGAAGVGLTAGRSLAVDRNYIAFGLPIWLDLGGSFGDTKADEAPDQLLIQRLVMAQDTGGAIRGTVRGDLFFGYGEEAGAMAGSMRRRGSYYLFLPKSVPQTQ